MHVAESYRQWGSSVVHRLWYHRGRVAVDRKLDALARHMDGRLRHLEDKMDAMLRHVGEDPQALGLRSLSLAAPPPAAVPSRDSPPNGSPRGRRSITSAARPRAAALPRLPPTHPVQIPPDSGDHRQPESGS